MRVTLLDRRHSQNFKDRLRSIPPDRRPLWGTMESSSMVRHLRFITEASLGEIETEDKSNFLSRNVIRFLFFYIITNWPKAKLNVPARYAPAPDGSYEEELAWLFQAIDRFVETAEREPDRIVVHELFGPVTLKFWRRIHGVHFAHHLRQFGA